MTRPLISTLETRMRRSWLLVLTALTATVLACIVPPEVLDAINRLPTPGPTATPVPSEVLYVDKVGDDDNDCLTAGTACLTIKAALGKAADGAAIYIGPGTYADNDPRGDWILGIENQNVSLYGAATPGGLATILSGDGRESAVVIVGEARVVLENVAIIDGGGPGFGLHVTGGAGQHVTLRNAELRNHARVAVNIQGGATVLFEYVRITANRQGAISNRGNLTLRNSRVVDNGSIPGEGLGSGVIYNDGTLRLLDSTVADNQAIETHVMHNTGGGSMTVERSTISGHRVGRYSALYNNMDSTMALVNSTVSGNSGSGITSLGDLNLTFTTISGNGLSGLYGNSGEADPMTFRLENSVIENNGEQDCAFQLGHSIVFDRRGRNLTDGSCDFDYGGLYPRPPEGDFFLGPLADNGGPTQTRALLEGSRGIDTATGPCLATDQRGVGRPVGGGCDVGSYEFTFAVTAGTPAPTLIPVETATSLPSATPPALEPLVTFIQNANCRKGPGGAYDVTTSLELGVQTPAVGRNEASTWWLVKVPSTVIECWVSGTTVKTVGDVSGLVVVPVAPLPAAPAGFQVIKATCSANLNDYPVKLGWADGSGESGYRLYRNGSLLAELGANATSFTDPAPKGSELSYEIEAFSAMGVSERRSLSAPACQ